MKIIICLIIIFILLVGFMEGIALQKTPDERIKEDEEQMEFLNKWKKERR